MINLHTSVFCGFNNLTATFLVHFFPKISALTLRCEYFATELLEEITRREKEAGIHPEGDVDAFMKVGSLA